MSTSTKHSLQSPASGGTHTRVGVHWVLINPTLLHQSHALSIPMLPLPSASRFPSSGPTAAGTACKYGPPSLTCKKIYTLIPKMIEPDTLLSAFPQVQCVASESSPPNKTGFVHAAFPHTYLLPASKQHRALPPALLCSSAWLLRTTLWSSASWVVVKSNFKPSRRATTSLEHRGVPSQPHKQGGETG